MNAVARKRFVLFCAVGVLNTAFGYAVFAALIFLGLHYALAFLFATCAGIVFNYFSNGWLVFQNTDLSRFPRFVAVYGIIYVSNLVTMELGMAAGLGRYAAGAVSMAFAAVLAYFLQSRFVFGTGS